MTTRMGRLLRRNPLLAAGVLLAVAMLAFAYPAFVGFSRNAASSTSQWRPAGLQGVLVHSLALGHRRPRLIFAAAHDGIYRQEPNQDWVRVYPSGDVWSIALLLDDATLLAADNDGYVLVSHDVGNHWQRNHVGSGGAYAVSTVPGHPRQILAGAGGGLYLSRDGGVHWQLRLSLPQSTPDAFAWKPGSERIVFAGAVANAAGIGSGVFVSRDGGLTWHPFGRTFNTGGGIMSVAVTPLNRVFGGTMGHAIWSVAGSTWHRTAAGMPTTNDHVAAILNIPGRPGTLFAGTLGFGIYRSADGGRHWTGFSSGLSPSGNPNPVLSLGYDPSQHVLFAGTADGVYTAVIR